MGLLTTWSTACVFQGRKIPRNHLYWEKSTVIKGHLHQLLSFGPQLSAFGSTSHPGPQANTFGEARPWRSQYLHTISVLEVINLRMYEPLCGEKRHWHFCVNTELSILTNWWLLLWSQAACSEKASRLRAAPLGTEAALTPSTLVSDPYLEFGVFIFYIHLSSAWSLFSTCLPSLCLPVTHKFVFLARHAAKFQSSKWPEWKPLNSHRFNHCSKLEPFVVRFWWRFIKISPMPPFTFFLSGLVKVSEKRRHQCQGP